MGYQEGKRWGRTRVDSCRDVACFLIFMAPPGARKPSLPHVRAVEADVSRLDCAQAHREGTADWRAGKQVQRAVERRGDWKQWRGGLVWRKSLLIGEQTRRAAGVGK